jgi:hypothetical protein
MDKEVRERFDQIMEALHQVDLKASSFLGWAKDYQDHNTKDKLAIKASIADAKANFDQFRTEEHIPLRDSHYSFRTTIYVAAIMLLLGVSGYLVINGQPWVKEAQAQTK